MELLQIYFDPLLLATSCSFQCSVFLVGRHNFVIFTAIDLGLNDIAILRWEIEKKGGENRKICLVFVSVLGCTFARKVSIKAK